MANLMNRSLGELGDEWKWWVQGRFGMFIHWGLYALLARHHPMRDNTEFQEKNKNRDIRKYREYLHAQTKELLTKFGPVDYIFFDFSYPGENGKGRDDWQSKKLLKMARQLQPHILVNDRLDLNDVPGGWDFKTPEQSWCVNG